MNQFDERFYEGGFPTRLTWEEKNPSNYMLDRVKIDNLQKSVRQLADGMRRKMTKIKADEKLFEELKRIAGDIKMLGSVIQNDMEVDDELLQGFDMAVKNCIQELWGWYKRVKKHIDAPVA